MISKEVFVILVMPEDKIEILEEASEDEHQSVLPDWNLSKNKTHPH